MGLAIPPAIASSHSLGLASLFGRLVEISGGSARASLTFALERVREAQQLGEPVCWITAQGNSFFPPDGFRGGVDLGALVVIRLPQGRCRRRNHDCFRAADHLLRCGGFGLVVLDLSSLTELSAVGRWHIDMPLAVQTRLAGLAKKHHATLLCLTEKESESSSLGPLVALRFEVVRAENMEERYGLKLRILKDKRGGVSSLHGCDWKVCRGPDGLC